MDKPFKTTKEQIGILRSRGMRVDKSAARALEREGYYSVVNGYKNLFIDRDATSKWGEDRYQAGVSFADVYRLFTFDRDLRLTMIRYFAQAEAILKTICAYQFSKEHQGEREAFLNPWNYKQGKQGRYRTKVNRLIDRFKRILHKSPYDKVKKGEFKREYIRHYVTNHDEVPLWVLTNFLTLGQVFTFYDYLPESTQNSIAKSFAMLYGETHDTKIKISPRKLSLVYDHIKDFRNICAHDERLYCARVSPSKDIDCDHLLADLELVLTYEENSRMLSEIKKLVLKLKDDLDARHAELVLEAMGIADVQKTFFPD